MKKIRILLSLLLVSCLFAAPLSAASADYDYTGDFSGGLAAVCRDGLWGAVDETGAVAVPLEYTSLSDLPVELPDPDTAAPLYSEGLAPTHDFDTGLYGYTDQDGRVVIEPRYQYAAPFHNGFARVMRGGLWGFVDARGCEVIPPMYLYARDFDEVGAWVQTGSGRVLISLDYAKQCAAAYQDTGSLYAFPSPSQLLLNGRSVTLESYEIGGSNYVGLRDAAALLSTVGKGFAVGWNAAAQAVTVTTGGAYTPVGGELTSGERRSRLAIVSDVSLLWDGRDMAMPVYEIDSRSFVRLRDLAALLDISLGWDSERQLVTLDTTQPYEGDRPWEKLPEWQLPHGSFDLSRLLDGNPAGQVHFLYSTVEFYTSEAPDGIYGVGVLDPTAVYDASRTWDEHLAAMNAIVAGAFDLSLDESGALREADGSPCFTVLHDGDRLGITISAWRHSASASSDGAVYQNAALELLQYLSGSDTVGAALWSMVDALQLDAGGSTGDFGFTGHEGSPQAGVLIHDTGARVQYDMQVDGEITFWFS